MKTMPNAKILRSAIHTTDGQQGDTMCGDTVGFWLKIAPCFGNDLISYLLYNSCITVPPSQEAKNFLSRLPPAAGYFRKAQSANPESANIPFKESYKQFHSLIQFQGSVHEF
jgi:hypothetical protein